MPERSIAYFFFVANAIHPDPVSQSVGPYHNRQQTTQTIVPQKIHNPLKTQVCPGGGILLCIRYQVSDQPARSEPDRQRPMWLIIVKWGQNSTKPSGTGTQPLPSPPFIAHQTAYSELASVGVRLTLKTVARFGN